MFEFFSNLPIVWFDFLINNGNRFALAVVIASTICFIIPIVSAKIKRGKTRTSGCNIDFSDRIDCDHFYSVFLAIFYNGAFGCVSVFNHLLVMPTNAFMGYHKNAAE